MSKVKVPVLKAALFALLLGGVVALTLYWASNWFFKTKNLQTLIKSPELGHEGSGDVVWPVGSKMPELEFKTLNEKGSYSLSQDRASLKIVNFWASWCEPCVEEFSSLARLMKKFDQGQISFVGISEDKSLKEAQDFIKAFATDFEGLDGIYFAFDEAKKMSKKYGVLALPETFILGAEGKLIRRISGFEVWDSKGAVDYVQSLVDQELKGSK